MNRFAAFALLACTLSACSSLPPAPSAVLLSDDSRTHPEHYVVITINNAPTVVNPFAASTPRGYGGSAAYRAGSDALAVAQRVASDHRLTEVAAWPIELLGVHCLVYRIPSDVERDALLTVLRRDARIVTAEPLSRYELHADVYNDPYAALQRNFDEMDIMAAHAWSRGQGVRVAVVDTGVDIAHPDLPAGVTTGGDFVGKERIVPEGHGTAVAGVIAAVPNNGIGIAGLAPDATVIALRACWSTGRTEGACNSFTLAQALVAALRAHVSIVNLSLGGPGDALLARIVRQGLQSGTVFVGAVPPSGHREGFPTGIEGVIAADVAERPDHIPGVIYAPGADVFTLAPEGHYDVASGSSIAAAEVTSLIALLMSSRTHVEAGDIEALLSRSMHVVEVPGQATTVVNACAALRDLTQTGNCPDPAGLARAR